jgi:hypothetical protein
MLTSFESCTAFTLSAFMVSDTVMAKVWSSQEVCYLAFAVNSRLV